MDFYNTFESLTNVFIQSLFGFLDSCDRFESCLALQGEVQVSIYSFESASCPNFLVHYIKVKQRSKRHRQAQLKSHITINQPTKRHFVKADQIPTSWNYIFSILRFKLKSQPSTHPWQVHDLEIYFITSTTRTQITTFISIYSWHWRSYSLIFTTQLTPLSLNHHHTTSSFIPDTQNSHEQIQNASYWSRLSCSEQHSTQGPREPNNQ